MLKRGKLQAIADVLCRMAISSRLEADFEQLCQLPDGRVYVDLLHDSANHDASGQVRIQIASELRTWMATTMAEIGSQVTAASIEIAYRTDSVPTDRQRIVMFSLHSRSAITTDGQSWIGKPCDSTIWHRRPGS